MMNPNNLDRSWVETAQYAAIQTVNRKSAAQQNRRSRILSVLLPVAAALAVILIVVLSLNSPEQEVYTEELENGSVVISTQQGIVREREYLDEGGLTLKIETFDANGVMTGYSEYAYTYDDGGSIADRTEYRYDADGTLISERQTG